LSVSSSSGYTVVQFTDFGNGTSTLAVPCSWLFTKQNQLMSYFPKTNAKLLIKKQSLPKSDWEVYQVRRLAFNNIPDYAKAIKKQKVSLLTSGIDTDDENDLMQVSKSKDKKKKNCKKPSQAIEYYESGPSDGEYSLGLLAIFQGMLHDMIMLSL
jgi:hypothetical protein